MSQLYSATLVYSSYIAEVQCKQKELQSSVSVSAQLIQPHKQ